MNPPISIDERRLRGNPGGRPGKTTPKPAGALPYAPKWLPDGAKQIWRENAPELSRLGIAGSLDAELFAQACFALALARKATEALDLAGDQELDAKTVRIWKDASNTATILGRDFGMAPKARRSMALPEVDELDPAAAILD